MFVVFVALTGIGLLYWAQARIRRRIPVPEAVPRTTIADLEAGRFRLVGRVVALHSSPSAVDESPCVYLERAVYRTVGSELVPLLREVSRSTESHGFHLDDGTGRIWVDPSTTDVDTVTLVEDEGLLAERRLRVGEQVELVASFQPRAVEADGGPYRANARGWEAAADECGRPQLRHPSEPLAFRLRVSDDVSSFMRGIGVFLLLVSVAIAALRFV